MISGKKYIFKIFWNLCWHFQNKNNNFKNISLKITTQMDCNQLVFNGISPLTRLARWIFFIQCYSAWTTAEHMYSAFQMPTVKSNDSHMHISIGRLTLCACVSCRFACVEHHIVLPNVNWALCSPKYTPLNVLPGVCCIVCLLWTVSVGVALCVAVVGLGDKKFVVRAFRTWAALGP